MVKLQLTLKSDKPNFIHALNGKSFKLQPGANTLILDYDDYVSLADALGIKPIENETKSVQEHVNDECSDTLDTLCTTDELASEDVSSTDDESTEQTDTIDDAALESSEQTGTVDDTALESIEQETIESTETSEIGSESTDDTESNTEEVEIEVKNESVDYSSWSLNRLKSKYKSVTGKTCKLKKDEIIEFLQDKGNNSDV